MAETSCNQLLLIDRFCYVRIYVHTYGLITITSHYMCTAMCSVAFYKQFTDTPGVEITRIAVFDRVSGDNTRGSPP